MDPSSHVLRPVPPNKAPIVYWRGIGKLGEEAGEINQLVGKAIAFLVGDHPDGKGPVRERFIEELGDLLAAIDYFIESNPFRLDDIQARRIHKLAYFRRYNSLESPSYERPLNRAHLSILPESI